MCDFGLSRPIDQNTGKGMMDTKQGTMGYMAPEISKETFIGQEIDMWAFGIVLYQLCVAYKPTQVSDYRYGKKNIC
jgi:serine/threonine protein kinase